MSILVDYSETIERCLPDSTFKQRSGKLETFNNQTTQARLNCQKSTTSLGFIFYNRIGGFAFKGYFFRGFFYWKAILNNKFERFIIRQI